MRIANQLLRLATIWSVATSRSRATLSSKVAQDSALFERLERGGRLTTETFERFLPFFRDGANWPHGHIPQDAADLLDNFENIATDAAASTGQKDETSPDAAQECAA